MEAQVEDCSLFSVCQVGLGLIQANLRNSAVHDVFGGTLSEFVLFERQAGRFLLSVSLTFARLSVFGLELLSEKVNFFLQPGFLLLMLVQDLGQFFFDQFDKSRRVSFGLLVEFFVVCRFWS